MQVTRFDAAKPYLAPNHDGVASLRLQGAEASAVDAFWCGISHVLPGGGAKWGAAPTERIYVVLDGTVTVTTTGAEATLARWDSCVIPAGEERAMENRTTSVTTLLVVMANPARTS